MGTLEAARELAIRKLEEQHEPQRASLYEFMKYYWIKERKRPLIENRHIKLICDKLEAVYRWEIKRLIIDIPPRSLKTETVSKAFPVWCLWQKSDMKFMEISYSSELAEDNGAGARDMYMSDTYLSVFPRRIPIREDKNARGHWVTEAGGQMFATGITGSLTGKWADIILIDDPIKPVDAQSDIIRVWANNIFHDTIKSRLDNMDEGAIVIIMQRLHDDDLVGSVLDQEATGRGEKWEKLIIPAIAEEDDEYRKVWDSFFEKMFPIEKLLEMKQANPVVFSTQYQQNPVDKDSQEFHEEWFRYYTDDTKPVSGRIFTTCDPAFSKAKHADSSCIITGMFDWMDMYILEYSVWKYDPWELIDKIIYHNSKRNPEKIGIESFAAQSMIWFNLKAELSKRWMYATIEEIRQSWDKEMKLRKLIPLYRNWHIYHKIGMVELEAELKRFPRGRHDDIIDAEQMLYSMYEIMPNVKAYKDDIRIVYNNQWDPIDIEYGNDY